MPKRMSAFFLFAMTFAAAAIVLPGCNASSARPGEEGYRTISVDPKRDSDKAKLLNQEGNDHLAKGELELAAAAFTKALDADVEFGPAHNNLGNVYYRQREWYKAAWEYEYATKLLPRFAEPRNNLGMVYEESGQLDKAVEQYRQAVGLSDDIQYRANLTRCLIRREGHTDEVRSLLKQLVNQDTRPDWHDWATKELSSMGTSRP